MLLEVRNLTKTFGGLVAVDNLSFDVKENEILGLIGPNGSGKTTVFNCITGFYSPDSGEVNFRGKNIAGIKPHEIVKKGICRTFQIVKPFNKMTVIDNVYVGLFVSSKTGLYKSIFSLHGDEDLRQKALELLEFVGLSSVRDELAENLTLGHIKHLQIARALATSPQLLLLDEPSAGLPVKDMLAQIELIKKIRDMGITIVIVEHVMKVIMNISDNIVVISYGQKIAEGSPKRIVKNEAVVKAYLGETVHA